MEIKESLVYNILYNLTMSSPVLSGNMQSFIHLNEFGDGVIIEAPYYDGKLFREKQVIVHTGKTYRGHTDYAYDVNAYGAFGSHNKSEGWVNRVLNETCAEVAARYGGKVIKKL